MPNLLIFCIFIIFTLLLSNLFVLYSNHSTTKVLFEIQAEILALKQENSVLSNRLDSLSMAKQEIVISTPVSYYDPVTIGFVVLTVISVAVLFYIYLGTGKSDFGAPDFSDSSSVSSFIDGVGGRRLDLEDFSDLPALERLSDCSDLSPCISSSSITTTADILTQSVEGASQSVDIITPVLQNVPNNNFIVLGESAVEAISKVVF